METDGSATDEDGRDESETVRVWLVERTYSDDEQNLIILTYATPDGTREFRKERALTSFTGDHRETRAALSVSLDDTATVDDAETRERYAAEVDRLSATHDPTDAV
ncbi:hypothetical protein [Halomarina ordinaria]|uniref:DUF7967 domain-containing protein n=1 Tax=Halomarina ordinaria TaxID=3033939 RepID=A0ABD5UEQ7_9EURY|nr:hypothetical protein [Halomarina sp. PSRA2]